MKKVYSLIALAIAMGVSANAAVPVAKSNIQDASLQQISKEIKVTKKMQKAPAMAPSAADIAGAYTIKYTWGLNSQDPQDGTIGGSFTYENGTLTLQIPYFSDNDFECTFDPQKGTITIPSHQDAFFSTNYNEMAKLNFHQIVETEDGGPDLIPMNAGVAYLQENGDIVFPSDTFMCLELESAGGYFFGGYNVIFKAPDYFKFVESEWTACPDAEFVDHCFNNYLEDQYQVKEPIAVPLMRNPKTCDFLLRNPYHYGEWDELNGGTEEGYIVFNISDPDCVVMRPVTNCGLGIMRSQDDPTIEYQFPYNKEGRMYYLQGWDKEDIYYDLAAVDDPVSSYNMETGEIEIVNVYFGTSSEPLSSYWFGPEVPLSFNIRFTDITGIDNVAVDANAPVKYFNLQGMEVVNPAKGQVVIKTQGNKASKVVF